MADNLSSVYAQWALVADFSIVAIAILQLSRPTLEKYIKNCESSGESALFVSILRKWGLVRIPVLTMLICLIAWTGKAMAGCSLARKTVSIDNILYPQLERPEQQPTSTRK